MAEGTVAPSTATVQSPSSVCGQSWRSAIDHAPGTTIGAIFEQRGQGWLWESQELQKFLGKNVVLTHGAHEGLRRRRHGVVLDRILQLLRRHAYEAHVAEVHAARLAAGPVCATLQSR